MCVVGGGRERSRRPLYSLHVRGGGSRTTYDDEGKSSAHTTTHEVGQENERTNGLSTQLSRFELPRNPFYILPGPHIILVNVSH